MSRTPDSPVPSHRIECAALYRRIEPTTPSRVFLNLSSADPERIRDSISVQLTENSEISCQRIRLSGVVQGVGFRPLVWRLAHELKLSGWVRNDSQGVEIEVCGPRGSVDLLLKRLHQDAPPLARIDAITSRFTDSVDVSDDFYILDRRGGRAATMFGLDTSICRHCLADMMDPFHEK